MSTSNWIHRVNIGISYALFNRIKNNTRIYTVSTNWVLRGKLNYCFIYIITIWMYILLIFFLVCIWQHHFNLFRLDIFNEPIASLSIIRGWYDAPFVHNKWISRTKNNLKRIKRPIGLDSHLSTIGLRWTCQRVCVLNFKLHIGVWTLIQKSSDCYSRVLLIKGRG